MSASMCVSALQHVWSEGPEVEVAAAVVAPAAVVGPAAAVVATDSAITVEAGVMTADAADVAVAVGHNVVNAAAAATDTVQPVAGTGVPVHAVAVEAVAYVPC